jgi:DNA-directed RNA polymerase beta subunit
MVQDELVLLSSKITPLVFPLRLHIALLSLVSSAPQLKYQIRFGQTFLSTPSFTEKDGTIKQITPQQARLRNLTYDSALYVDVEKRLLGQHIPPEQAEPTTQRVYIGRVRAIPR